MASRISTTLYYLSMLPCLFAIPVKQVDNIDKRGATDADCYGTECYFDEGYYNGEDQEVKLPENLTEAIMSVLPAVQGSQTKIVKLLNQSLVSSQARNDILTAQEELLQEVATRNVEQLLGNITTTINDGFKGLTEQIHNFTESVVSLLQNQLDVQKARLPVILHDCQDIVRSGADKSGSYSISPPDGLQPFTVFCDMETAGGGWTVFQRRFDGAVDFFRGWEDYENGFGSPDGEYWLGLHNIWRFTRNQQMVLRIDMESFDGDTAYAVYDSFAVGDAASKYQLTIGSYSGTAGDSLRAHNYWEFSTKDRDNDGTSTHCAKNFKGGWWYRSCHYSNLNGLYVNAPGDSSDHRGIIWRAWKGMYKSVKHTEMKMRRA